MGMGAEECEFAGGTSSESFSSSDAGTALKEHARAGRSAACMRSGGCCHLRLPQVLATYSVAHRGFNPNTATITDAPNGPGSPRRPPAAHQC